MLAAAKHFFLYTIWPKLFVVCVQKKSFWKPERNLKNLFELRNVKFKLRKANNSRNILFAESSFSEFSFSTIKIGPLLTKELRKRGLKCSFFMFRHFLCDGNTPLSLAKQREQRAPKKERKKTWSIIIFWGKARPQINQKRSPCCRFKRGVGYFSNASRWSKDSKSRGRGKICLFAPLACMPE